MKDDLAQKRRFEIEIDNLKRSNEITAGPLAVEAEKALRDGKYDKVAALLARGKTITEHLALIDFLVTTGGMKSKAEARRCIDAGGVFIDGKLARHAEIDIKHASSIRVGTRELL